MMKKTISKKWKEDTSEKLLAIACFFKGLEQWDAESIKEAFSAFMNAREWNFGMVMVPIRLALVGSSQGIDLFVIFELIGKEETIRRIERAVAQISTEK